MWDDSVIMSSDAALTSSVWTNPGVCQQGSKNKHSWIIFPNCSILDRSDVQIHLRSQSELSSLKAKIICNLICNKFYTTSDQHVIVWRWYSEDYYTLYNADNRVQDCPYAVGTDMLYTPHLYTHTSELYCTCKRYQCQPIQNIDKSITDVIRVCVLY